MTDQEKQAFSAFVASAVKELSGCADEEARQEAARIVRPPESFSFSSWRHGGWYVNVRYPTGASGCVSKNYDDGKWRIVCDDRRDELNEAGDFTFPTREAAAHGEFQLALQQWKEQFQAAGADQSHADQAVETDGTQYERPGASA